VTLGVRFFLPRTLVEALTTTASPLLIASSVVMPNVSCCEPRAA
jgi:hypothetical protein